MEVDAVQRSVRYIPTGILILIRKTQSRRVLSRILIQPLKELKSVLIEEFHRSMVSDVPVGVCISGGVDSNVLISILTKN